MYDCSNRDDIQIYRFFPHGSKKLANLKPLNPVKDYFSSITNITMICNDQEPLNFELYNYLDDNSILSADYYKTQYQDATIAILLTNTSEYKKLVSSMNLAQAARPVYNLNDNVLLVHSEKNSHELTKYEGCNFIGVYYWSHALIARDWFRYAQVDPKLYNNDQSPKTKDFLIYNRAWSGTREYRIKFADLLVQSNLLPHCVTKFNAYDLGLHYQNHSFVNKNFVPSQYNLENFFDTNNFLPTASADYNVEDYSNTGIEVVLETLFDDQRLHLTEKTLRPLACGKPFMLAATPGSLQYLKEYGFKTFSPYIDETYDTLQDPLARLKHIILEMQRLASLDQIEKSHLYTQINQIAKFNQSRFFSQEFFDCIVSEYQSNLLRALKILEPKRLGTRYKQLRKLMYRSFPEARKYLTNCDMYTKQDVIQSHLWIKKPPPL